jgi:hypothetical protein
VGNDSFPSATMKKSKRCALGPTSNHPALPRPNISPSLASLYA